MDQRPRCTASRRRVLAVVGAAALAGCGDDTETVADEADGGGRVTQTPTSVTGETPAESPAETGTGGPVGTDSPSGEAQVEFTDHELVVDGDDSDGDGGGGTPYVQATAENSGDAPSGRVTATITWYDGEQTRLGETTDALRTLGAGEVWLARVEPETNQEDVADYELNGEFDTEPPSAPEGVEVTESDLAVEGGDVLVAGTAENDSGGTIAYLEAIARLFDERGRVLDDQWTNESEVADGDDWSFEIEFPGYARADQVAEHGVVLNEDAA